ncbi:MAG: hypothetical protein LBV67_06925 [Streptococcaceae bacterium]|nr:hypothetical protein [Streptococcaceae bacterium]
MARISKALLISYFHHLGVQLSNNDLLQNLEVEDAYAKFGKDEKATKVKEKKRKVYKHKKAESIPTKVVSKTFSVVKLKSKAKEHNVTIGEYLLALIFMAIAKERSIYHQEKLAIAAEVPVDFRSFYPSNTIRNFAGNQNIIVEDTEDFPRVLKEVKRQMMGANQTSAQITMNEAYQGKLALDKMPKGMKKFMLKTVTKGMHKGTTFMYSNLGQLSFPEEITKLVDSIEFVISPTQGLPYTFSVVSIGDVLTLTATVDAGGDLILSELFSSELK